MFVFFVEHSTVWYKINVQKLWVELECFLFWAILFSKDSHLSGTYFIKEIYFADEGTVT
jgi:hypothetical protein